MLCSRFAAARMPTTTTMMLRTATTSIAASSSIIINAASSSSSSSRRFTTLSSSSHRSTIGASSLSFSPSCSSSLISSPSSFLSSSLSSSSPSILPLTFARSYHNPRRIRGVGPNPRVSSFMKQPWIRRRLASARAKLWSQTHTTPVLDERVRNDATTTVDMNVRNLSTSESIGSVRVSSMLVKSPLRRDIIWTVVRWQRACRRAGTHKTKDRSEVYGSGKKARPQKGSGRARMGDPHSPHHPGGGQAFARRTSDYSYKLPQNIINMGKRVALSTKYAEGNLYIIDTPTMDSASTQDFLQCMKSNKWGQFLMIHLDGELDPNLIVASRSNDNYTFLSDAELNVYDVINAPRVVITLRALESLEWRLAKGNASRDAKAKTARWMVGSYGGGYTRSEIEFVLPGETPSGPTVEGVDIDGAKMVIIAPEPYITPIHWP